MATAFSTTVTTIVLFLAFSSACSACNKQDLAALHAIADFDPSANLSHFWNDNIVDCCLWNYLECDSKTGRVNNLQLNPPNINFNGPIPPSIGDLSALEVVIIYYMPNLTGPLPIQLSKLKRLRVLDIHNNQFSGPIPSFLSQFPALTRLDLSGNKFVGAIPPSLGNLVKLDYVALYGNQLTGPIPASLFGKLASGSTTYLDLSENKLTGTVPRSFANVPFRMLFLEDNKLTGDASFLFGKSKPLVNIMLARNKFKFDLTNVQYPENLLNFDISHNQIYGSISNQATELAKLNTVVVSYNKLCGKIPTGGNFGKMQASYYEHNKCLCGSPLPACN